MTVPEPIGYESRCTQRRKLEDWLTTSYAIDTSVRLSCGSLYYPKLRSANESYIMNIINADSEGILVDQKMTVNSIIGIRNRSITSPVE